MAKFKTTRFCAGEYRVTDGVRVVSISQQLFCDGYGWTASADWDQWLATDPLPTKREAVRNAHYMLEDAAN